ncbi:Trehalose utilization [Caulifigura coniformis]|uniref:Trehalose utilization n=1 Tax=Caulifigura coniformis TaxID=2527983 RepID=A0A517SLF0_9PLAN|nr:PVC-type heme-binding CxxCH protein [Caulifigura coniformis]QDT56953.1 Trehalose utilization [Caulifigura coniformis]
MRHSLLLGLLLVSVLSGPRQSLAADPPLRLLFLGDNGPHRPAARFRQLQPVLSKRGIELIYTDQLADLNRQRLDDFAGLVVFANQTRISKEQEQALLEYVAAGRGFIPLHCASFCFQNSDAYIALVGAQFQRHGTGVFRVEQAPLTHPILEGFQSFESWDETYQHHRHHEADRIVLEYRVGEGTSTGFRGDQAPGRAAGQASSTQKEPWTWVRTHGDGRVFYTAWGHDDRTWSHPGFHNLVERGIRWACQDAPSKAGVYRDAPAMTAFDDSAKPFEFTAGRLPNYPAGEKWGTNGELIDTMQKPLDPDESMKHMVAPVGFRPALFAAEPQIGKPLAMNWDERGRLWIIETLDYPNELQPEGEGRDRIRICEDTDGDGQADKFTIFADKLSIPTSLAFAYGGVIVHQAPQTLFLRDTTGDDVADERHVLLTGWGTRDTHAGPSNLNYGLDGWYYGIVGYSGFEGEIAGEPQKFQTGFYRFRLDPPEGPGRPPRVVHFEFLRNTNNNSWGVGLNEEGILFGSTANGNPSEYMPIANRYYERVRGWSSSVLGGIAFDNWFDPVTRNVRQVDWHGGFTAGAGHALYTARVYPPEYWNRTAFVAESTGHLVATFTIQPSGAGFRSRNSWNLVASRDEWTAPIAAEIGPDGQVWFIDWYNIIVQHNPTPVGFTTGKGAAYETDLRDKRHGRIYRLVYSPTSGKHDVASQFPPDRVAPPNLKGADSRTLVQALRHTNLFWRRHAQRLLMERREPQDVVDLVRLITETPPDAGEQDAPGAMHALWVYAGLSNIETRALLPEPDRRALLASPSPGLRRNAILALAPGADDLEKSGVLNDSDLQTRLAALLHLADLPSDTTAARLVLTALADPVVAEDRWLLDAATSAAAVQSRSMLSQLTTAATATRFPPESLERLAIVGEHLARSGDEVAVRQLIAAWNSPNREAAEALVSGVTRAWPRDKPIALSPAEEQTLADLFQKSAAAGRTALLRFSSRIGSSRLDAHARELTEGILTRIRNRDLAEGARIAAARDLIELRKQDVEAVSQLLAEVTPAAGPEVSRGLIEAMGASEAPGAPDTLTRGLPSFTPQQRSAAIRVLLARTEGIRAFLDAVERGEASLSELALDQKQSLLESPQRPIARRTERLLSKSGGLPNPDRQIVIEELKEVARSTGNAAAGKEVFRQQCSKCHLHSGEGNRIGPDLTGMAVHPKEELLVHILDPSRSVEGNYRSYTVATADGHVINGLLASESKTALEFFDSEGKRRAVQREDIEQFVASTKSLMPEGFEKQVPREALADLLEFLTQRGQYLPLPLEKVATAVSTRGMFHSFEAEPERLIFSDWSPKSFNGVPFVLVDPGNNQRPNVILLNGPSGRVSAEMPRAVTLLCNSSARSIHLLSGVSGWGSPLGERGSISMIVRLRYADGSTEEHELKNGEHFADYIRRVDVPGSQFAFALRDQQVRYLSIQPRKADVIQSIEFIKGPDRTAPVVMAVTIEAR